MLTAMSWTTILALAVMVSLVLWVLWHWGTRRMRSRQDNTTAADLATGPRRFDTTMGELRDMREALGSPSKQLPKQRRIDRSDEAGSTPRRARRRSESVPSTTSR
jgi:hypothetical protein